MSFTDELHRASEPILAAIAAHPFVRALGDGTLPRPVFEHYLGQDARYLVGYGRAMALLAARAPDAEALAFWAQATHGAVVAERELHAAHVALDEAAASPSCLAYTDFLVATAATAPYEVGSAAILPCFWIYQEVGTGLLEAAGELASHAYGDWIGLYSDEEFAGVVEGAIAHVDAAARHAGDEVRAQMRAAYLTAARYEWMFFDAAWRQETWPV